MNCRSFQNYINGFLQEDISDRETRKQFVTHALECQECYDELEIYYTLQLGLELAEEDISVPLDFKTELIKMLNEMKLGIQRSERVVWLRKSVFVTTNVITVLAFIMYLIKFVII